MFINQLKTRTRRPCRLALAVGVSALASAVWVSPALADSSPVNIAPPTISWFCQPYQSPCSPMVGYTLTATSGSWSGAPYSYDWVWMSCDYFGFCTGVGGGNTYYPRPNDYGHTLMVKVTASNAAPSRQWVYSAATPIVIWPGAGGIWG